MAVIDASVYIALINAREKEHASCRTWFQRARATQEPVVAPVILLAEVSAALRQGVEGEGLAHRVVQHLKGSQLIELVPVTLALAEQEAIIAADHRIRGCDAVYVALADQRGEHLVTLDRQQLERGAAVVTTHEP